VPFLRVPGILNTISGFFRRMLIFSCTLNAVRTIVVPNLQKTKAIDTGRQFSTPSGRIDFQK
jgi:hypothetical protein